MNSRVFMFMFLLLETEPHGAAAMTHSLRYFHTFSSQVPNFPEFVSVGYVDGLQITHYDSNTKKYVPKQEWMKKITEEDPRYWEKNTRISLENNHTLKFTMETAKQRLNVTEGLHLWQNMYGCEWDDETNETRGYDQYAFDGEDFIAFDFETGTFVAPKPQALVTKLEWERRYGADQKNYIIHECAEYLKKHVRNGEHVLKRTELPLVSLLQKSSSAPVTCHATGFYPDRALLFWTKDGHELIKEVYSGYMEPEEILPNGDGTFQTSVSLDLSSVPHEHWDRYHCVFQWSGVKDDYVTRLDRTKIMTNEESPTALISVLVLLVAVAFVLAALAALVLAVVAFSFRRFQEKSPTVLIPVLVLLVTVVLVLAAIAFVSFRRFKAKRSTPHRRNILLSLPPSESSSKWRTGAQTDLQVCSVISAFVPVSITLPSVCLCVFGGWRGHWLRGQPRLCQCVPGQNRVKHRVLNPRVLSPVSLFKHKHICCSDM